MCTSDVTKEDGGEGRTSQRLDPGDALDKSMYPREQTPARAQGSPDTHPGDPVTSVNLGLPCDTICPFPA